MLPAVCASLAIGWLLQQPAQVRPSPAGAPAHGVQDARAWKLRLGVGTTLVVASAVLPLPFAGEAYLGVGGSLVAVDAIVDLLPLRVHDSQSPPAARRSAWLYGFDVRLGRVARPGAIVPYLTGRALWLTAPPAETAFTVGPRLGATLGAHGFLEAGLSWPVGAGPRHLFLYQLADGMFQASAGVAFDL
jgi:hypothetical protein